MLVALLSWKQTGHVIRLISQWLSAGLGGCGRVGVANIDDEKGRGQKVRRKVSFGLWHSLNGKKIYLFFFI